MADFQNSFTAQSVCQPTHDDGNVLDLLITAEHSEILGNIDVHNPGCSDHKLVTAELDVGRPSACRRQFTYRNVKVVDPVTFAARLNAKSVCTVPADDVNTFADQLDRDITDVLDQLAPRRTRVKRCGKRISRWLSDDVVAAKRLRRKLERRWRLTQLDTDRIAYRKACRSANTLITKSRQSYYQQRLQEGTGNQGLKWRVVRELLHSDERKLYSSAEASKLRSNFSLFMVNKLSHIANVVRDRLASTSSLLHPPITRTSSSSLSYLDTVTATEVADVIRLLPQKSSPLDVIPVSLLKLSTDIISPLIARLANLSFKDGVFPSRYKAARVTPLLKKPNLSPHEPANYRPISNLCTFPKY